MRPSLHWIVFSVALIGLSGAGPLPATGVAEAAEAAEAAESQDANRRRAQLNRSRSRSRSYSRSGRGYRGYRGYRGNRGNRGYRGSRNYYRGGYRYGFGRYPYYRNLWSPYGYGYGYGYGYYPYYSGYYGFGYPYYGSSVVVVGGGGGYGAYRGAVRVQVKPEETQVYVNGYYSGLVDDYDGMFQRLYLEEGEHQIELYLAGHRTHAQAIYVEGGQTLKLRHTMVPLGPGEAEPAPPEPRRRRVVDSRDYRDDTRREPRPPRTRDRDYPREPPRPPEPREPEPATRPSPPPRPPEAPRGRDMTTVSTAPTYGRLVVRAQPPNSEIWIDGELWGSLAGLAEITIHLAAGSHEVEVRSEGYQGFRTTVEIRESESTPLNVHLSGGLRQQI